MYCYVPVHPKPPCPVSLVAYGVAATKKTEAYRTKILVKYKCRTSEGKEVSGTGSVVVDTTKNGAVDKPTVCEVTVDALPPLLQPKIDNTAGKAPAFAPFASQDTSATCRVAPDGSGLP